jgi:hypothetical protein
MSDLPVQRFILPLAAPFRTTFDPLEDLTYHPLPAPHQGRAVVRVKPIPESQFCLAVVDGEPGFDTAAVSLPRTE